MSGFAKRDRQRKRERADYLADVMHRHDHVSKMHYDTECCFCTECGQRWIWRDGWEPLAPDEPDTIEITLARKALEERNGG